MHQVGRYEVTELLGQGGMGTVYKAFDPLLARVVAVKVISTQLSTQPELRERFFREARAAAQLDHPNIITVHDLGEQDGAPYLAMQFLEGEDLEHRMHEPEGMSLGAKIEVALAIATGLGHAHAAGVVHRDVKPANVFITTDGQVKVLDFGLARLVTSEMTRSNVMVGTVNYMAPEQLRSEKIDHRADIFSLGVVLYELFGGKKPFQADSFASTMYKILDETPEPLERLVPSLPPRLIAIVDRAIAKSPEHRYQSMADLIRDLDAAYAPLRGADRVATQIGATPRTAFGARPKSNPSAVSSDPEAVTVVTPTPSRAPVRPPSTPDSETMLTLPASVSPPSPSPAAPTPRRPGLAGWQIGAGVAGALAVLVVIVLVLRGGGAPAPATEMPPAAALPQQTPASPATAEPPAAPPAEPVATPETPTAKVPEPAETPSPAAPSAVDPDRDRARRAEDGMQAARAAAVDAGAPSSAAALFTAADRQAAVARTARSRGRFTEAAARADTATSLFQSAADAARQAAAREAARRAEQERPSAPPPAPTPQPAPPPAPAAMPLPAPVTAPPAAAPTPPAPKPAPAAPAPAAVEPVNVPPETRVARDAALAILGKYTAALEQRDMSALKAIWPGLGGREQAGIQSDFSNASSISVAFDSPKVDVSGTRVTVSGRRHYTLRTRDGQTLQSETLTTLNLHKAGEDWVIDSVRHQAAR